MSEPSSLHLGLIGWPLGHSLSPVIHDAAMKASGQKGEYKLYPVQELPEGKARLLEILQRIRHGEIHGVNVTVPHKQNVIPLLDSLSPAADQIGAVNTVYLEGGKLMGDNTDKNGFLTDLNQQFDLDGKEKTALVLGAGGSSRAVTCALIQDGWDVQVAARRIEQAQSLVDDLQRRDESKLSAHPLEFEALRFLKVALVVNTTPLGMAPNISESPWPSEIPLPEDCFVYDLVYNPSETELVKLSRKAGLRASNGLGMLIEQAAMAFEIWTGVPAPRLEMVDAVSIHLQAVPMTPGGN